MITMDPFQAGLFITIGAAVVGMFLRIEHRITKVETTLTFIQRSMTGCQPTLEDHTK